MILISVKISANPFTVRLSLQKKQFTNITDYDWYYHTKSYNLYQSTYIIQQSSDETVSVDH